MPHLSESQMCDRCQQERRGSREEGDVCLPAGELSHELDLAFNALGGATFALLHHRALIDERLERAAQRIYELYAQIDRLGAVACGGLHGHDGSALARLGRR